ncbi:MAG: molybdopterin-binding protein [Dethiobacter sp.]|nr:molybdopterin-binding protein [Dethiobacter sp.]
MKKIYLDTEKAIGHLICHDITKIEPGSFKGPLFKRGHLICAEDLPVLLDLGKKRIYALELEAGELHEDEAGLRLAHAVSGSGLEMEGPAESRVNLKAATRGLLTIDVAVLNKLNEMEDVIVSTLHSGVHVEKGERVAGVKVVPLVVPAVLLEQVEQLCLNRQVIAVKSYRRIKPGLIITGREVAEGRIKDGFLPVLNEKAQFYEMDPPVVRYIGDDEQAIAGSIVEQINQGLNLIIVTGGMSVDPDDLTPAAIKLSGAELVKYGAPILPGAMFLLAYRGEIPVIGLPACAMYYRTTILDLLLPRILAGERVTAREISILGHGGLCRACIKCVFPHCSFGK